MTLIYYKSIRKLSKTIPLWLLTLSVCWISTRPDLHRHRLSSVASSSSRPIKQINNNCFTLLPVLVLRLCKFDIRVIAPVHHSQSTWTKHGYLCFSQPDLDPNIDIIIYMDIATNPGPVNCNGSVNNSLEVLYLNARSVKSFVLIDNINHSDKVCKITLLQELVYGGKLRSRLYMRHMVKQYGP